MSQMYDKNGKMTPVTLILAGPCYILQKKNKEKEGYDALQIGLKKIENPILSPIPFYASLINNDLLEINFSKITKILTGKTCKVFVYFTFSVWKLFDQ